MKKTLLFFLSIITLAMPCRADSPLTSTSWWDYYSSKAIMQEASELGCTKKVMQCICNPDSPIDLRLALVNCIGWNFEGQSNYSLCIDYYQTENKLTFDELKDHMSPETFCVFAYMLAMDDYFDVKDALEMAEYAYLNKPKSRAIGMIYGLIAAQNAMSDNWCDVYNYVARFANDKTLLPDMSDYAVKQIMSYIDLYKEYCK